MGTFDFVITCLGLGAITLVSRGLFSIGDREVPIPAWLRQGLRYAPLAAMVAVVAPEIVLTHGQLVQTWREPRLFAAAAAAAYYAWRRGILGTIATGIGVLLMLRLGLGW